MIEIQHMAHDINLELKSISLSETVDCFFANVARRRQVQEEGEDGR